MTSYVENETGMEFPFSVKEIIDRVMETALETEECPYEASVNVLLTDNEGIREFNKEYRNLDKETDVLSFPNVDYTEPADFDAALADEAGCFDPDSGELLLGDIIVSADKVKEQALSYGHSERREFAFLIAHSMLHLCGYDHMEPEEASIMEAKQARILDILNITRD